MFCGEGFQAEGEVRLPGAHMTGGLDLTGAKLANPGGRAPAATGLRGKAPGSGFLNSGHRRAAHPVTAVGLC